MNISSSEAEQALAEIQGVMQKTRRSIATTGAFISLIVTGIIWLVGFLGTQFLSPQVAGYVWAAVSSAGILFSIYLGIRIGPRLRSPSLTTSTRRGIIFWLLLLGYCLALLAITRPTDGKQTTLIIILFIMLGQFSMGLLQSFSTTWWAVPVSILALIGYFLLPNYFYLWMGVLGGGSMIGLALYIRSKW